MTAKPEKAEENPCEYTTCDICGVKRKLPTPCDCTRR